MASNLIERLFSVAGKTVLVTGGSSGIGYMLATAFAEAGARVYITGRKADRLDAARAALAAQGDVHAIQSDLGTREGVAAVVAGVAANEDKLHVLINNAGITWGAPVESFPAEAWDSVLATNVRAPFALVQGLLPRLEAAASDTDPARVVNIGSIYGISSETMTAWSYGASKAAIHHLTVMLAAELAPKRILVNAIAPGFFPSRMTGFVMKDAQRMAAILEQIPLHRAGSPEDIAGLALYLCSRAGAYMTGNVIPLDGGILASH